jgi:hypothetical protein
MVRGNCGKVERCAVVKMPGLLSWYGLAYSVSREVGYELLFNPKTICSLVQVVFLDLISWSSREGKYCKK